MRRASAERMMDNMMDKEMKRMTIRLEEPKDYREVENLTRGAFCKVLPAFTRTRRDILPMRGR